MNKLIGLLVLLTSVYAYSFSSAPANNNSSPQIGNNAADEAASELYVVYKTGVDRGLASQELSNEVMEELNTELVSISTMELCPDTDRCATAFFPTDESMANEKSLQLLSDSIKLLKINEKIYSISIR